MPRRALAAALVLLAACSASVPLEEARVTLHPAEADPPADARLALLSVVELRADVPAFAGFSALEVSADGRRFVALSDRSTWLEAEIVRRDGRIVDLRDARLGALTADGERPVIVARDSEGLAIPDPALSGPRFVSFERLHRIARLNGRELAGRVAAPEAWSAFPGNGGLEALAALPGGGLLALQEKPDPGQETGGAYGYGSVGAWTVAEGGKVGRGALPRLGDWSVTGADFASDGRLYVVARRFDVPGGFSFAIWRYEWVEGRPGQGEVLLELPPARGADNGEGIAAWRDAQGRIRLLVIADDNFSLLQRTLLYEFILPAGE